MVIDLKACLELTKFKINAHFKTEQCWYLGKTYDEYHYGKSNSKVSLCTN